MDAPYGETVWTRLEPISRDDDMRGGLRAELRDPMWMLTRQWQLGEFDGEDAGSPVDVTLDMAFDHLSRYRAVGEGEPSGPSAEYEGGPLEPLVEREAVLTGQRQPNARLAVQGGETFLSLLRDELSQTVTVDSFHEKYRLDEVPADEDEPIDEAGQRFANLVTGRVLDGHTVFLAIDAALEGSTLRSDPTFPWDGDDDWDGPPKLPTPDGVSPKGNPFEPVAKQYHEWYADLYEEPDGDEDAWDPTRMEYNFEISTGGPGTSEGDTETVLSTERYTGGSLDWPDFSPVRPGGDGGPVLRTISMTTGDGQATDEPGPTLFGDGASGTGETTTRTKHFLPTKVRFKGMPSRRYWEFEDGDVRLEEISSADVSSQTLLNFALVYGNDWYSVPVETPLGSLARVTDLSVTDTFGITDSIGPVREEGWNAFSMRDLPGHDHPGLFLPPVLDDVTESDPVERVSLSRDEVANLAFAVEERIEDPTGQPLDREEYVSPELVVERVDPAAEVPEESVQFRNPGREPLDLSGWIVTDGTETYTFADGSEIPAESTATLHSGSEPPGEASATDFYWGATAPIWHEDGAETTVLSVYAPCEVDAHSHAVTPTTVTSGSPPLAHLRVRKRIPLREAADLPPATYALATDLFDHWFALRPSAERYAADIADSTVGDGRNLMQYRYRHYLELALVLDAESLDAATVAQLPDPEGWILRPYPDSDTESLRVYDEELHGGGTTVSRTYQLTNWTDGSRYLWSGREARPGTDDVGSSTLRYDVVENWTGDDRN